MYTSAAELCQVLCPPVSVWGVNDQDQECGTMSPSQWVMSMFVGSTHRVCSLPAFEVNVVHQQVSRKQANPELLMTPIGLHV